MNFWELSEPLIAQWVRKHLSPEAQAKRAVKEAALTFSRIQKAVKALDHLPNIITADGIKFHPETLKKKRNYSGWWLTGLIIVGLLILRFP